MSNLNEEREEFSIFISLIICGFCLSVGFSIVVGLVMDEVVTSFAVPKIIYIFDIHFM